MSAKRGAQADTAGDQAGKRPKPEDDGRPRPKKYALLMGFQGTSYAGMQRNIGFETIESTLLRALLVTGCIDKNNYETPQSMHFQRCARTDKGVHAARQVVAMRMILTENTVDELNAKLPDDIRIFGAFRTTKGFNPKNACTGRRYEYLLPTYALMPKEKVPVPEYRVDEPKLTWFRETLKRYIGTHKFHNFTAGKSASDDSCRRYITDFTVSEPFEREGIEWVRIQVKGQSFILHQIRKMIGLAVAIVRGHVKDDYMDRCFSDERVDVPKIPGLGLFLDCVFFDYYNKQYSNQHQILEFGAYDDVVESFKAAKIHSHIISQEKQEQVILRWLNLLFIHRFNALPDDKGPKYKAGLQFDDEVAKIAEDARQALQTGQQPPTTKEVEKRLFGDAAEAVAARSANPPTENSGWSCTIS
ncbi:uncharacterized protein MONBRDRAFT_32742 [Monosiga brevicollis MX1]|uniref:Pseudouridine synthase I TruA alpha/beta domain-containing protein n=1 Tax=Monosiga brevicollis TaxID=81824 RepID=A9V1F3_MONBE|nr:uncharacterized protein MONBRDRAFT_32742 [Monosiga brevicollis MX1]EDQ88429.1 predicted protein [Monosiga brevicollis MX1]|eukprot:XP_001746533.1 hypothetical protein [Monosiga brevicollis MX1]